MPNRPPLLYLCHRIPFPPNKGDKIRSFNVLRVLAEYYDVYLGSFVDDADDWRYADNLRQWCRDLCLVSRVSPIHRLLAGRALLTGTALSVTYYRSVKLQRWVDGVVRTHGIGCALLFCSPMAQFVAPGTAASRHLERIVLDLVDVDSEKWRQYAEQRRGPAAWLFGREHRSLLAHERRSAALAHKTFLVSGAEAKLFRALAPESAERIGHFSNGVDTEYFSPERVFLKPFAPGSRALVFTGAMDYWPNVDAAVSFAREIFPGLKARWPELEFWVVGSRPTAEVLALGREAGVHVTGRVEDVRPYLSHALAAVAPMRVARGIQNKVLEAMAMGRPVIASKEALEGIDAPHGDAVLCASEQAGYAEALEALLGVAREEPAAPVEHRCAAPAAALGTQARAFVDEYFQWRAALGPLLDALSETTNLK